MSTWFDNYKAQLDSIIAAKQKAVSITGNNNLSSAYALLIARDQGSRAIVPPVGNVSSSSSGGSSSKTNPAAFTARGYVPRGNVVVGGGSGNKALDKAVSTTFNAGKSGISNVLDFLSRGNYASANLALTIGEQKKSKKVSHPILGTIARATGVGGLGDVVSGDWSNELSAVGRGLSGKEKNTYADVFRQAGITNNKAAGLLGFAGDVLLDPTTYIGAGVIKSGLRGVASGAKAVKGLAVGKKAAEEAVSKAGIKAAEVKIGAVPTSTVNDLIDHINSVKSADKVPYENLPFAVKPTSTLTDAIHSQRNADVIQARARAKSVTEQMGNITAKRYSPSLQIDAPFKSIEETVTTEVPKATKGIEASRAKAAAAYQRIVNDPGYRISVGNKSTTVAQLKDAVVKNPESAAMVNTILRQEATKLASSGKDIGGITIVGKTGKAGAVVPAKDLEHYLATGSAPKGSILNDNLDTLNLTNLVGKTESIKNFLKRMGIHIEEKLGPPFDEVPATTSVTKTTFKKFSLPEKKAWIEKYKDVLDKEDIDLLLSTKISKTSSKAYNDALEKIMSKTSSTSFTSVDDLLQAIKDGRVDPADLKKLQDLTGAKSPAGIKNGLNRVFKNLAKLEDDLKKSEADLVSSGKRFELPEESAINKLPPQPKPASEIIRNVVEHGNDADLVSMKAALDPNQVEDLENVIKLGIKANIVDPHVARRYDLFPHETKLGTARTEAQIHKGRGITKDWNMQKQFETFQRLITRRSQDASDLIKEAGLVGTQGRVARQRAMYEHIVPVMRAFDKFLIEQGNPPVLLLDRSYVASLTDVMDSLPTKFVQRHMFDGIKDSQNIPATMMNIIGGHMLDYNKGILSFGDAMGAIKELLLQGYKNPHNPSQVLHSGVGKFYNNLLENKGAKAAEDYIDGIGKTFLDGSLRLSQKLQENIAELTLHNIDGAAAITDNTLKAVVDFVSSPEFSNLDILRLVNNRDTMVDSIARSLGITSDAAKTIAKSDILVRTSAMMPPETVSEAVFGQRMANAVKQSSRPVGKAYFDPATQTKIVEINRKALDSAESAFKEIAPAIPAESLSDMVPEALGGVGMRLLRAFSPHLSNSQVRPIFLDHLSPTQTNSKLIARASSRIMAQHSGDDIAAAFKEMQNGTISSVDTVAAAQKDLQQVFGTVFNADPEYNHFMLHALTPTQVNAKALKYGVKEDLLLPDENFMDAWKSWDLDPVDILDVMNKYHAAIQSSILERELGADLSRLFGSKIAKPGMVRIKNDGSILSRYLDPSMYFEKDIAKQFSVLEDALKKLNEPKASDDFLKYIDSVIHSYKAGLTIYRPGHHIRNMVGDIFFNWMDGVNDPRVYELARRVMVDNHGRYKDIASANDLVTRGIANPKQSRNILTVTVKGKKVQLTTGDVYRLAFQHGGVLPDYSVIEDIGTAATRKMWKPRPFGGKVHNAAASFSEGRDHYVRLAHFIDKIGKGNYESLDDAARIAANRVRKWHPDGSDLGTAEVKYARRTILFYSWMRKAVPLVVEGMVLHPGKSMVIPKAMFAVAEANGINPTSFGDPFPVDQLFPDWLRDEGIGPMFGNADKGYWSINPGVPTTDVLSEFGNGFWPSVKNVLGSTNPFIKWPAEYALPRITHDNEEKGTQFIDLATGIPSKDVSDYVDQQTPGLSYLSNISNRSASSLFTQRTGVGRGMTDEQKAKAEAKNPGTDTTALINFLTGMRLTNQSKPGTITTAQFDQKRAIKKAQNASR